MKTATLKKIFFVVILIACITHFYNLNWGAPYYFHPDERNIASSISQLSFPNQFNPHFFAYGSFPLYTIYFAGLAINSFQSCAAHILKCTVDFSQAIQIGRFFSALFSFILIFLLYKLGTIIKNNTVGLLTAFFSVTSIGFIQFSHFATFELWTVLFSTLLFFGLVKSEKILTVKNVSFLAIISGCLLAIKISNLPLLIIPFLFLLYFLIVSFVDKKKYSTLLTNGLKIIYFFITVLTVYLALSPFTILDSSAFQSSIQYETNVATGNLKVFYTGEFFNTTPVLFQFTKIYPFLLNPLLTLLFPITFAYLFYQAVLQKKYEYFLLTVFFITFFFSQAFLYVKWVRYLVPTLPFMYLILSIGIFDFLQAIREQNSKSRFFFDTVIYGSIVIICAVFGLSYFTVAFIQKDTRIQAYDFAKEHIQGNAPILSEVYDLGITPFNGIYHSITLFNFYELDNNSLEYTKIGLSESLMKNNYFILPSQRILGTRLKNKKQFPQGYDFYSSLITEQLGYKKIYETPCDIFCKIAYFDNPKYAFEQSTNVFDRPTFLIFQKQ